MQKHFSCAKCNSWEYETDEIRTTGSGFTRFFDIQNRKFTVVSCKRCGYSELYKAGRGSTAGSILDFLTN
ncbi:zinc ribbon domain-containing protein [Prolixibacteraceae bacterium Z1-6]|uniref:Zinc ribbon domain-containing protein n=1 Tax=Draconibacterium aestuarii TaxID=2998507 RepID=A0A9X3F3H2_9BACT|nr:zinc ribbon domain-containing protein [Prolixibacteraceae bacterium Z1-6]